MPIRSWKNFIIDLLFPKFCVSCHTEGDWVCDDCQKKIIVIKTPTCFNCNKITDKGLCSNCRKKFAFRASYSATYFSDPIIKALIHRLKYKGTFELAEYFSQTIYDSFASTLRKNTLVTAVPLHHLRYCERGYNQSALIAQSLAKKLDIPFQDLLKRKSATKSQAGLHRKERLQNLSGAFIPLKNIMLENQTILLIDDVITTGTTANECAKVLISQGAKSVTIASIAHG